MTIIVKMAVWVGRFCDLGTRPEDDALTLNWLMHEEIIASVDVEAE